MKIRAILLLGLAVLVGTPCASAQSFKDKFKKATEKVGKTVKKEVQEQTGKTTKEQPAKASGSSSPKRSNAKASSGDQDTGKASLSVLTGSHTALFAPVGQPVEKTYGTKSVAPVKPPKEDAKQPDWNDARTPVYGLDNKSLVAEYEMMEDCMQSKYIGSNSPASFRHGALLNELDQRTKMLNRLAEYYYNAKDDYANGDEGFAQLALDFIVRNVLDTRAYKTLIRSSIAPFFTMKYSKSFIKDDTRKYFKEFGGYENAHKANFTVLESK